MNFGLVGNLSHRLMLARTLPPRLVLAKIAKRLPWTCRKAVRIAEIVNSPKELQPDRLIRFFLAQEKLLRDRAGRAELEFEGRNVIEIGPGPLGGWGPMAVFRGARRVYGVDPDWVDGVFSDPAIEAAYLRPHYAALSVAFGQLMSFEEFNARLVERLTVKAVELKAAKPGFAADIIISNSCLEHIDGLDAALAVLAGLTAPHGRFMHMVNFGNHRNRVSPFTTIYEMSPEEYHRLYGAHINLFRPSDVEEFFAAAGIETKMTIIDQPKAMLARLKLHPYWQGRYTLDELAIRTGIFCEPNCGTVE